MHDTGNPILLLPTVDTESTGNSVAWIFDLNYHLSKVLQHIGKNMTESGKLDLQTQIRPFNLIMKSISGCDWLDTGRVETPGIQGIMRFHQPGRSESISPELHLFIDKHRSNHD